MEFIYRLFARRKYLLRSFFIISLLVFASLTVTFLPQIVNPHILRKYLGDFVVGHSTAAQNTTTADYDFRFLIHSNTPSFLNNMNSIAEKVSQKVYGMYQVDEIIFFAYFSLAILNISNSDSFLIGVSAEFYQALTNSCLYPHTPGAILLSQFQNDSLGAYQVSLLGIDTTLNVTNKILASNFASTFPNFERFLREYLLSMRLPDRLFFMPINELIIQYDILIQSICSTCYSLQGYILFTQNQKDIICWSRDSLKMVKQFETLFMNELKVVSTITFFSMSHNVYIEENIISKTAYAFISTIQLVVWTISIILCLLTVKRLQSCNFKHELRILFAGKRWHQRLSYHLLESLMLSFASVLVASAFLFPFLKALMLFQMSFSFSTTFLLHLCLIHTFVFFSIFSVFIDFEFFLHRNIEHYSEKIEYRLFAKVPRPIKWSIPFIAVLIFWSIRTDYLALLMYVSFVGISFFVGLLTALFARIMLSLGMRHYYKKKERLDNPLSSKFILLKLWHKRMKTKLFTYTFVLVLISSAFLFMNYSADAKRSEYLWWMGAEIGVNVPAENTSAITNALDGIPQIIDFTPKIIFNRYSKGDEVFSYRFNGSTIIEVSSSYMGERIDGIVGLNFSDYFQFYDDWNKKGWLKDGELKGFDEQTIFVSQAIHAMGIKVGDTVSFYNSSYNFTVKGIIGAWPSITDQYETISSSKQLFIVDLGFLQGFLKASNISYNIHYKVHTAERDIQTVVDILSGITTISINELEYLNLEVFVGIRKIFLNPMIILAQLVLFLWGGLFLYENFERDTLNSKIKQLGIIALIKDNKRPLSWYLFFEGSLLYLAFFFVFVVMFAITFSFLQGFGVLYNMKTIVISRYTIYNSIFLLIYYLGLLIFQPLIEYRKLKELNLSLLYRHSE
ncbi:MAG: hypothetical protein K9W42_03790 [Candidatus Heimdallarchaeota archaeon]|nr:hypothetical protein [Candidatus Heimdallarchaeota archaeon]